LHNFFRFLKLRLDPHAQLEIRHYASAMHAIGEKVCPVAFAAFDEHILNAVKFSRSEMSALQNMLKGQDCGLVGKARDRFIGMLWMKT
jgi:thymidylate synthase (FAD)